jgi:hypothetical protein
VQAKPSAFQVAIEKGIHRSQKSETLCHSVALKYRQMWHPSVLLATTLVTGQLLVGFSVWACFQGGRRVHQACLPEREVIEIEPNNDASPIPPSRCAARSGLSIRVQIPAESLDDWQSPRRQDAA